MNDPGIIISYDELRILLYNRGFRSCNGILMPDRKMSDEEVLQTLNRLAVRGMIRAKEDHFVIEPDTARIVDLIGDPAGSYSFSDPETGQVYYCYIAEHLVVVSENYWKKKDTLRLRKFTPAEFSIWREELEGE